MSTSALNAARHAEVWRLTAYAVESSLLELQIRQLHLYRLSPTDLLIFNLIAVASVQRSVRGVAASGVCEDIAPSDEANGTISRRRVSEATGVARASVARAIERLKGRGFVVEPVRGQLRVPVGIVLQGAYACDPQELYTPVLTMIDQLQRLGVVHAANKERS